jgi:hypothetical protein
MAFCTTHYEKEMRSQFTVMRRTAMSEHQKMAILSNELVRRLSNIHQEVFEEEIKEVI